MRNKFCVIDFEMQQPSNEPFQLGAVCVCDAGIYPDEHINYYITLPDGILPDDATFIDLCNVDMDRYNKEKMSFKDVYDLFCIEMKKLGIKRLASWGNDIAYFKKKVEEHGLKWEFDNRFIDVKTVFEFWQDVTSKRNSTSGLRGSMKALKLDSPVKVAHYYFHNALFDAIMTANVYLEIRNRFKESKYCAEKIIHLYS